MKRMIFVLLILMLTSCNYYNSMKFEQTKELMGTFVTITVYDMDKDKADEAISLAFDEIQKVDDAMSDYKNNSKVFLLNKNGFLNNAPDGLIFVLEKSKYYSLLSQGAFDVTVKPILNLYSYSFENLNRPPNDNEIKGTLKKVNSDNIVFVDDSIVLKNNSEITLGGIAKGYAIDKAIESLGKQGIEHALVNAGGDMRAIGKKPQGKWQIALQNPRDKNDFIAIINLDYKSVATSGDYERYFNENKSFHHIVNPKTGYSATDLISVTIVADKAIDADALATSVFVLGAEEGLALIESLDNVEGLIITKEKEIIKSSGFD